jgi:hypothetical protein
MHQSFPNTPLPTLLGKIRFYDTIFRIALPSYQLREDQLCRRQLTTAAGAAGGMAAGAATGLTALLAGLVGIDLAMGELAGADTLVLLICLGGSVILYNASSVVCRTR